MRLAVCLTLEAAVWLFCVLVAMIQVFSCNGKFFFLFWWAIVSFVSFLFFSGMTFVASECPSSCVTISVDPE